MSEHKKIRNEILVGVVIAVAILVTFCVAVTAGALEVKQLPSQPELKVEQGSSKFYEDGSIELQPASRQPLQNTIHASELQG